MKPRMSPSRKRKKTGLAGVGMPHVDNKAWEVYETRGQNAESICHNHLGASTRPRTGIVAA